MPVTATPDAAGITVEVVYAEADRAICKSYRLSASATVGDALRLAAADADFAALDLASAATGVYGKAISRTQPLAEGDRIEIYRALAADPKTARRSRVERARRRAP
jgi:putative ubiquitin-RnfH superfamily antitoxin RatB of RatAB toxin-antitoxin module